MRFMVLVKADKNSEAGVLPTKELLAEMGKFNEELVNAHSWSGATEPRPPRLPSRTPSTRTPARFS